MTELIKVSDALARALSVDEVNQLGRDTGQAMRLRSVTPHRLFLAVVSTLASARVESLADLLRAFNHQNGVTVAYKAFYNRLARIGFATFMRAMLARLLDRFRVETLTPDGERAVARFRDIVIHDGSSFALKPTLRTTFPGRFTTIEPAAVEIHATYSGFADEVCAVQVAPDKEAERPFLPGPGDPDGLLAAGRPRLSQRRLLRGGPRPAAPLSCASRAATIRGYGPPGWKDSARPADAHPPLAVPRPTRRSAPGPRRGLPRRARVVRFRVVVLPGREAAMTRLCTNLPRTPFSRDLVARLYRFRWQIELCSRSGSRTRTCISSTRRTRILRKG